MRRCARLENLPAIVPLKCGRERIVSTPRQRRLPPRPNFITAAALPGLEGRRCPARGDLGLHPQPVLDLIAIIADDDSVAGFGATCFRMEGSLQIKRLPASGPELPAHGARRLAVGTGKELHKRGRSGREKAPGTTPALDYAASCASINSTISPIFQSRSRIRAAAARRRIRASSVDTWQPEIRGSGCSIRTQG